MIYFDIKQTWVMLGSGDIWIEPVTDSDGRVYLCLTQSERGPITDLDKTEEFGMIEVGKPIPPYSVVIESTELKSIDNLILGLEKLKDMMKEESGIASGDGEER